MDQQLARIFLPIHPIEEIQERREEPVLTLRAKMQKRLASHNRVYTNEEACFRFGQAKHPFISKS